MTFNKLLNSLFFLFFILFLNLFGYVVFADTIPLGVPYFCIDDNLGNSNCGNATDTSWWNMPIYKAPYDFNNVSGLPIPTQFNFKWTGANLCSGEDMLIKGTLGLLFDFGTTHDLSIEIYSGGQQGICTLKNIDNSRYDFSCSVQGGGDLIFLFKSNTYKAPSSYQIGISKNMNIVCEPNNGTIIENNNQNTQDIINNQNQNQAQTNQGLNNINDSLNNSNVDTSTFGDTFDITEMNTWLPAGPIDSIINLPLNLMNSLVSNLSNNTCNSISLTLPFVDEVITLPCASELASKMKIKPFLDLLGIPASTLLLYHYFIYLYGWYTDNISLRSRKLGGMIS